MLRLRRGSFDVAPCYCGRFPRARRPLRRLLRHRPPVPSYHTQMDRHRRPALMTHTRGVDTSNPLEQPNGT